MKALESESMRLSGRREERGAALLSTLLISILLLAGGGALVMSTNMQTTTTLASTAEMQAYYGAEAGLQAAVNVIRGNKAPLAGAGLPTGTRMRTSFRASIDTATSNKSGDPISSASPKVRRLSAWLDYSYPGTLSASTSLADANRVVVMQSGSTYNAATDVAYKVEVIDPDNTGAPNEPARIVITSTGYGPNGAVKLLQMMIQRTQFQLDSPPATITVRGPDGSGTTNFATGDSNAKTYNGSDHSGTAADRPAIASTGPSLGNVASGIKKPDTVTPQSGGNPLIGTLDVLPTVDPAATGITPTPVKTPPFMATADDARSLVSLLKAMAQSQGEYYSSGSAPSLIGSADNPEFVFIDGDYTLGPGDNYGLLVVTGDLTFHGNVSFYGIIIVFGNGVFDRKGGGNGDILGAIYVAKFGATGNFLAPTFDTSGAGNSNIQYDTNAFNDALSSTGRPVIGIVER